MDTLTRIRCVTDLYVRCTDKREIMYGRITGHLYTDNVVPRSLEAQLNMLDKQALAIATQLCELHDRALTEF